MKLYVIVTLLVILLIILFYSVYYESFINLYYESFEGLPKPITADSPVRVDFSCADSDQKNIFDIVNLLSSEPNIGLIYPTTYYRLGEVSKWEEFNFDVPAYLEELKIPLGVPEHFDYPAGGMFWARTSALKEILTHNYIAENFADESNYQEDRNFHLPWIIERLIGIEPEKNGFDTVYRSRGKFTKDNSYISLGKYLRSLTGKTSIQAGEK
jgi:hypothetical protein